MEKYCLKWSEFESNIRESFRKLREENTLFDVTLATDDGHTIQAHKMVLAAGSNLFSDMFMKMDHSNMLIYLKGIRKDELDHVIDFLYKGEASISQEELNKFMETAKDLKVKGLQNVSDNGQPYSEEKRETYREYPILRKYLYHLIIFLSLSILLFYLLLCPDTIRSYQVSVSVELNHCLTFVSYQLVELKSSVNH